MVHVEEPVLDQRLWFCDHEASPFYIAGLPPPSQGMGERVGRKSVESYTCNGLL